MPDPNTISSLVGGWSIKGSTLSYLVVCATLAIMVRIVHCIIKAWDVGAKDQEDNKHLADLSFGKRFKLAFYGFDKDKLADLWLGTIIGFAEISFYPVLIFTNNLSAIGGWLAIKTAGGWNVWHEQPRSFNRFLVANLVNLSIAYFLMVNWVQ